MDVDPESCPACLTCCVYTCISHHRTSGPSPWHFTGTVSQQSVCICWLYLWDQLSVRAGSFGCLYLDSCHFLFLPVPTQVLKQLVNVNLRVFMNCQSKLSDLPLKRLEERHCLCENTCSIIVTFTFHGLLEFFLQATITWGMTRHNLLWSATLLF